jgi:hypothetical protein
MLFQRAIEDPLPFQEKQDVQPSALIPEDETGEPEYEIKRILEHKLYQKA